MHDLTFAMQFACLPAVCGLGPILLQTSNLHDVAFPLLQRVQIFAIKLVRGSLKFCKRGTRGGRDSGRKYRGPKDRLSSKDYLANTCIGSSFGDCSDWPHPIISLKRTLGSGRILDLLLW